MRTLFAFILLFASYPFFVGAQEPENGALELNGDVAPSQIPQLSAKLNRLWLFPEDYEGKTVHLKSFLFEAENLEPCREVNGYLFSCEPVVFAHNDQERMHIGNARHLSRDKLNFVCSDEQGQAIRNRFKQIKDDPVLSADVTMQIRREKDGAFWAVVTSFSARPKTPR